MDLAVRIDVTVGKRVQKIGPSCIKTILIEVPERPRINTEFRKVVPARSRIAIKTRGRQDGM